MKRYELIINGKFVKTEKILGVYNKYNRELFSEIYIASEKEIEQAIESAALASLKAKKLSRFERAQILDGIADGLQKRQGELVDVIIKEAGKPRILAEGEVKRAILTFEIAAEEAKRIKGEIIPVDIEMRVKNYSAFTVREPIGVIFGISPFNFPLNLTAHKAAPAIASGNSIIIKPSSLTPLSATILSEIALLAGAIPGMLNVINLPGKDAQRIAEDPRISMITFTGSGETGWNLKKIASKKRVTLELGGNAGAIVDKDANLEWAAKQLALGSFAYAGQICISVQRIFAHKDIYDRFRDLLINETSRLGVGDPDLKETICGPIIDDESCDRIMRWIDEAQKDGAKILFGNKRNENIIQPTIIENAKRDLNVKTSEIFGPVVTIDNFSQIDEAINLVNDSKYGLQASIFSNNFDHIGHATRELNVGGIIINDAPTLRIDNYPYGGVKESGCGREGVKFAMEEMTELKCVVTREG